MFRLARDLGVTVGELAQTMSHGEFLAWTAYYSAEYAVQQMHSKRAAAKAGGSKWHR